jgi:hypothetical protein
MDKKFTIKLFVNQKLVTQRKVNSSEVKRIIEMWTSQYALKRHNYEVFIYVPSKMNK